MKDPMKNYRVEFLPNGISVEVEEGTTVAEAAHQADVFINNICGSEGSCGKCRVRISKGRAEADVNSRALLSEEDIRGGYVLACQTQVHDNLAIVIPPESRTEDPLILIKEALEATNESKDTPLVTKAYIEFPPPTLEDNISDLGRISRGLKQEMGLHVLDIPLNCLHHIEEDLRKNDWKLSVTIAREKNGCRILDIEPLDTAAGNYGIVVDVGTTTVVVQLIEINSHKVIGVEGRLNLQARYGEDVISRIIRASGNGGLDLLHEAVVKTINELIEKLARENDVALEKIHSIVAAGNTTMSHFLLGLNPCFIRLEPYVPVADVYPQVFARDIGIRINPNGIMRTIPGVASYVGGDIVAGVLSSGIARHEKIGCLIDIGTNGEIAIGNNEWLVCCSASAGPAFEGGGTRCGMRAAKGAIEKVAISNGRMKYWTIGNKSPIGICGSGLIDCIYELVKNGIIAQNGKFHRDLKDTRLTQVDDVPQYMIAYPDETETGMAIVITQSDIDNLIKSKGAVFAAIKSLIEYVGVSFDQIDKLYVAGGFGNFLDVPKAIAIGLLPDIPEEKIRFIGNSCLTGARMCLLSEACLDRCLKISQSMTNIELSNYQPFTEEYIAALFLPHTDRRLFPSVKY